jgi:DNA topoisomerase-1
VEVGETLKCVAMTAKEHATQPPGRYSEAALTKALEEKGIGRPSTYASIIDTIQARNYVFKKGGALVPTWVAFSVVQLLESHLANLIDYQFTAQMEDDLDAISRGEREYIDYLKSFYFGNGAAGLKPQLKNKVDEIDARDISRIWIGTPEGGEPVYVRVGRYSPFVEQGDRTASLADETPPDEVTLESALKLLDQAKQGEEPLGIDPETQKPVYLKVGRFGPYVQRGSADDEEKPQNASLLRGMKPEDIDLATAIKLLSLPRNLGPHPQTGADVMAFNGRFGPYVKSGDDTRSLPADVSPLDVTLEQALALLAQPKTHGRGRAAAKREPLKVFDASPVTGEKVQLLDGRYGPYVSDGVTNASVPKGTSPEELTFEAALDLLAARAALGPPKKKAARKKAATKKAAPVKKAATKKRSPAGAAKSAKKKTGA